MPAGHGRNPRVSDADGLLLRARSERLTMPIRQTTDWPADRFWRFHNINGGVKELRLNAPYVFPAPLKKPGRKARAVQQGGCMPSPGHARELSCSLIRFRADALIHTGHSSTAFPRLPACSLPIRSQGGGRWKDWVRSSGAVGRYGSPACGSSLRRCNPRPRAAAHRAPRHHPKPDRET